MNKLFIITIALPSFLFANTPAPVISHEGINIHLNVANSHDVEKKDNAQASNQSGDPKPQVIHLIISKQEESLMTKIKHGLVMAATMGLCAQLPLAKLAEIVKHAIKRN